MVLFIHPVYLPVKLQFSKNLDLEKFRKKTFLSLVGPNFEKTTPKTHFFTLFFSVWWSDSTHVLWLALHFILKTYIFI